MIGVPDAKWGERPKAFVVLKPGATTTEEELLDHVRGRIARYKAPREVLFIIGTSGVQRWAELLETTGVSARA